MYYATDHQLAIEFFEARMEREKHAQAVQQLAARFHRRLEKSTALAISIPRSDALKIRKILNQLAGMQ